jgi:hypothetical protein
MVSGLTVMIDFSSCISPEERKTSSEEEVFLGVHPIQSRKIPSSGEVKKNPKKKLLRELNFISN